MVLSHKYESIHFPPNSPSIQPHDGADFLCYTIGPCWLSTLNIVRDIHFNKAVCTCELKLPSLFCPPVNYWVKIKNRMNKQLEVTILLKFSSYFSLKLNMGFLVKIKLLFLLTDIAALFTSLLLPLL